MKKKPLVSLLIPTYNHEKFIDDIMNSIIEQTYENLEVIITDDASSDHTYSKMEGWIKILKGKFGNVELLCNQTNRGIPKTLNHMLGICNGKYIKVIASDDFLLPKSIEILVDFLENRPEYGLVFANGIVGDKNTHYPIKAINQFPQYYNQFPDLSGNIVEKMYCKYFLFSPSIMYSRKAYESTGKYDEEIWAEDWDYYLRIAENMPIGYLNEPVVMYRMSDESASHSTKLEYRMGMRKSEIKVLLKHREYVNQELSKGMLEQKCNEVFKEAFDMRSKQYMNEIYYYMMNYHIRRTAKNKFLHILFRSHLIDFLFA